MEEEHANTRERQDLPGAARGRPSQVHPLSCDGCQSYSSVALLDDSGLLHLGFSYIPHLIPVALAPDVGEATSVVVEEEKAPVEVEVSPDLDAEEKTLILI